MNPRTSAALAVLTAVGAMAAVSVPAAHAGYGQAKFKAEVKGVQTHTSEYHHVGTDVCDPSIDSSSSETLRFKSTKPVLFTATKVPGQKNPILTSGLKPLKFPTKARVTRSHTHSGGQTPEQCGDNGGGVGPGAGPDCGSRTVQPWLLGVGYFKKGLIEIQPESSSTEDLFERCGSGMFPYLVAGETFGWSRPPKLTSKDLFDEEIGKLITIGRGQLSLPFPEGHDETNLRWELSLTRVKGRR